MQLSIVSTTPLTAMMSFLVTFEPSTLMTSPSLVTCTGLPSSVCRSCEGRRADDRMSPKTRCLKRKCSRNPVLAGSQSAAGVLLGRYLKALSIGANIVVSSEVLFSVEVQRGESWQSAVRFVSST